jgi:hypothetical protein
MALRLHQQIEVATLISDYEAALVRVVKLFLAERIHSS